MTKQMVGIFPDAAKAGVTSHLAGLPPQFTEGIDRRIQLPLAEVLVIRPESAGVLLIRWKRDGTFCGDTWHSTLEEALEQVLEESPLARPVWHEIDLEDDALKFALRK